VSGELKNFSVVYSAIFFVYWSSIGWFGSRPNPFWAWADAARQTKSPHTQKKRVSFAEFISVESLSSERNIKTREDVFKVITEASQ